MNAMQCIFCVYTRFRCWIVETHTKFKLMNNYKSVLDVWIQIVTGGCEPQKLKIVIYLTLSSSATFTCAGHNFLQVIIHML